MIYPNNLPKTFEKDIQRAVQILREEGCSEIYLFGSTATGHARAESDLDLAVRGCPRGHFFSLIGRLLVELDHTVDLVDLDRHNAFAEFLQKEGTLVQIA
jgi:predicted nucleotidyltransferase